ncbi:MAG TPA: hypothetical protein VNT32_01635 [Thermoleophilaceae bacterium]|nr:hypothetical protein [Thermoleophilaceae bacterium]
MKDRPRDAVSLVAGVAIAGLGVLLLLDTAAGIGLTLAYLAPAVTATAGAILLARGLGRSLDR